jgi:glycosyltransferase involved in cell wall biosynthesis
MQRTREARPGTSTVVDEPRLDDPVAWAPADAHVVDPSELPVFDARDDRNVELLLPSDDVSDPEVSIVIPSVNEELTISEFVQWCKEGLAAGEIRGEILIVDSSVDRTAEIALRLGARVLKTPKRGLGRAYIDAIPYIRGKYVVMGDADCTYDFRQIKPFVDKLREGFEFAMGSRWRGSIEAGSMPALHRYLGTPATTTILNWLYGSKFTDIHCGMRGISKEALDRMGLVSQSWEYASEMVLKSVRMQLRTTEVPVTFYKDRDGRLSHHKRSGWSSPFKAAWINLRAMFVYRAEFFVLKPGLAMLALGLLLTLPLTFGPISIGPVHFSLYWMLLGVTLSVLGIESFFFGCLAQVFCDYLGDNRRKWTGFFRYTPTVLTSIALFLLGFGMTAALIVHYLANGFTVPPAGNLLDHMAVTGLLLMIVGFSAFCFTLVLHATGVSYGGDATNRHRSGATY